MGEKINHPVDVSVKCYCSSDSLEVHHQMRRMAVATASTLRSKPRANNRRGDGGGPMGEYRTRNENLIITITYYESRTGKRKIRRSKSM
jgi:hypothetical protein